MSDTGPDPPGRHHAGPLGGSGIGIADVGSVVGGNMQISATYAAARDLIVQGTSPQLTAVDLFQLPADISEFTGREDAVAELLRDLGQDEQRPPATTVSTIVGGPGVGKTALAIHIAHRLRQRYPLQLYVNLRGAEEGGRRKLEPHEVLAGFLRALGVDGASIPELLGDRASWFRARLADRRVLVVLDNAADSAQVSELLPGTSESAALITSRKSLVFDKVVPKEIELGVLKPGKALQLLKRLAGAKRVREDPDAAGRIIELCGYLPLALRIAGAKLALHPAWRLRTLQQRLEDEHRRLRELSVGSDMEVRSSFGLSYDDLSIAERRAFRLLGLVDAPDFATWVAAALLNVELDEADELLGGLYLARLLEELPEDMTGQLRYRFHDLLRLFARERLGEEEPRTRQQEALERSMGAHLAMAEAAALRIEPARPASRSRRRARWPATDPTVAARIERHPIDWFRVERAGLVAAVQQAHKAELWECVWELADALAYFLDLRSIGANWLQTQELALDAARQAKHRHAQATALLGLGTVHREQNHMARAARLFQASLRRFRALGDRHGQAWAMCRLGDVRIEQSRFEEAGQCLSKALEILEDARDEAGAAWTSFHLAILDRNEGNFERAKDRLQGCLALFRRIGDRRGEAQSLHNLGIVHRDQEWFDQAVAAFHGALAIFNELGDRRWALYVPHNLGIVAREQGNFTQAVAYFDDSLAGFHQLGDAQGEGWTDLDLGILHRVQGRLEDARACFDRCLAIFAHDEEPSGTAWTQVSYADLCLDQGRPGDALARLEQALPVIERLNELLWKARALQSRGRALHAIGDRVNAEAAWRNALELFRELGAGRSAAEVEALLNHQG